MKQFLSKLGIVDRSTFLAFVVQFIKFGIVGVSNTAISLAIYYLFIWIDQALYQWGNIIGWVVSVANAFFWGNRVVFKSTENSARDVLKRLGKSYLSYGATFLLATLLLYLEVEKFGWSAWLAPVLNLLVTIPLNFLVNKFWTFRN